MPRQKKNQIGGELMTRYLQKQGEDPETASMQSEIESDLLEELKKLLKNERQVLSTDLKEVKQELVTLKLKFAQIEGKLRGQEN